MTDPYAQFVAWYADAQASELNDPSACALATAEMGADNLPLPDVRMVLMRSFDARGFVFHTNYQSRKGQQIRNVPRGALAFHWKSLRRQVRAAGAIQRISIAESDEYFATRPRASQLSAWASHQSERLESRDIYEARLAEMDKRFPNEVPRPAHWGGYRLSPDWIEYWEDREGRQHHRLRWDHTKDGWVSGLLYP